MKLAIATSSGRDSGQLLGIYQYAHSLGMRRFWVPDQEFRHDPFIVCNAIARFDGVREVGLGLLNVHTRHPVQVARAVATLQNVAPGVTFKIGWGAGNRSVTRAMLGRDQEKPVERCRQAILVTRELLAGETVTFSGLDLDLRSVRLDVASKPAPQFIGTRSPKLLELAGEIADGILLEGVLGAWGPETVRLVQGKTRRQQEDRPVELWAWQGVEIVEADQLAESLARWKPWVAHLISSSGEQFSRAVGIPEETRQTIRELITRGEPEKAAHHVSDDWVGEFVLIGTPDQCHSRLTSLKMKGFAGVCLLLRGSPEDSYATLEQLSPLIEPNATGDLR